MGCVYLTATSEVEEESGWRMRRGENCGMAVKGCPRMMTGQSDRSTVTASMVSGAIYGGNQAVWDSTS